MTRLRITVRPISSGSQSGASTGSGGGIPTRSLANAAVPRRIAVGAAAARPDGQVHGTQFVHAGATSRAAVADNVRMHASGQAVGAYDEVFDAAGAARTHAAALVAELERLGGERLVAAGAMRDAIFMRQGITFDLTSADGAVADRPFPLDLIPRIIPSAEWRTIKRGLAQRIRALNAFVDDVYHAREIIRAGIVPWALVASRSHFARAAHGIRPPRGVYTHIAGCDLVRDA